MYYCNSRFTHPTDIVEDGAPVHKVECLQQAGCLEGAWNSISQLDLNSSIITLPMVGQSSPSSSKRRIPSTPFCSTSIVPFSSTPSTSAVIPSPASPLTTPASGTTDNWTNVRHHGRKLKGSNVMLAIRESIVNNASLNASIDAVDIFVRKWFNNARDRSGGRADRKRQYKGGTGHPSTHHPETHFIVL
ncbi:hypothetical protein EG68_05145 [Paragonimus skrjabini miyazakii]|uniref:Uncharacterized protein n=1 Tax=Paragonimus skrjabini miyazakii TaxID=59628 RepID=A0A8S9YVC2_9TREM|nr:hypothetical protein EG68_05145 [Paragonimus skrjabini miyazakii]